MDEVDDILLEAKMIVVTDTFDAMTEDRAYRKAFKEQIAIAELRNWRALIPSNKYYKKKDDVTNLSDRYIIGCVQREVII